MYARCQLEQLPEEVLCLISSFLSAAEVGRLRHTNREISTKTQYAFDDKIRDTTWRMSDQSLSTLIKVASKQRYGARLNKLTITNNFLHTRDKPVHSAYRDAWRQHFNEQIDFFLGSRASLLLSSALSRMPALRDIDIGQWCPKGTMPRFGWGGPALFWVTDRRLHHVSCVENLETLDNAETDTPTDNRYGGLTFCLSNLLAVLSVTQQPIESLSVGDWSWMVPNDEMFVVLEVTMLPTLRVPSAIADGLCVAFAHLKTLRLCLGYDRMELELARNPKSKADEWLSTFLKLTPALGDLTLVFDGVNTVADDGLFSLVPTSHFFRQTKLSKLRSLSLANAEISVDELCRFLIRHASTLRKLELWRLQTMDVDPVFSEETFTWSRLFDHLGK